MSNLSNLVTVEAFASQKSLNMKVLEYVIRNNKGKVFVIAMAGERFVDATVLEKVYNDYLNKKMKSSEERSRNAKLRINNLYRAANLKTPAQTREEKRLEREFNIANLVASDLAAAKSEASL